MAKPKVRGYSREHTPRSERRVSFLADKVPPTFYEKVMAKIRRSPRRLSVRSLLLELLERWLASPEDEPGTPPSGHNRRDTDYSAPD